MTSISGFSWNGRAVDPPPVHEASIHSIMENIRASNQIYTAQVHQILFLNKALEEAEQQAVNMRWAYEECREEVLKGDAQLLLKDRKLGEAEKIIQIQKTKTHVITSVAIIIITYLIVK